MEVFNKPPLTYEKQVELLEEYKNVISLDSMGFPKGWEEEKIWKD